MCANCTSWSKPLLFSYMLYTLLHASAHLSLELFQSIIKALDLPYLFGCKSGSSPLQNDYKITKSVMTFCFNKSFTFLNNPKYLDLSYKTDLDFEIVLERKNLVL